MLTQLKTLKARLGLPDSDVKDDALLSNFILAVSSRMENEANRTFAYSAADKNQFEGDEMELRVSRYPIDETQTISFELLTTAVGGWIAISPTPDYIVRRGCIISLLVRQATEKQQLRVTYAGGYILPGTAIGVVPLPDDLEQATIEQCVYSYQNKDRLGITGMTGQGGGFQQMAKLDMLPTFAAVAQKYERWLA